MAFFYNAFVCYDLVFAQPSMQGPNTSIQDDWNQSLIVMWFWLYQICLFRFWFKGTVISQAKVLTKIYNSKMFHSELKSGLSMSRKTYFNHFQAAWAQWLHIAFRLKATCDIFFVTLFWEATLQCLHYLLSSHSNVWIVKRKLTNINPVLPAVQHAAQQPWFLRFQHFDCFPCWRDSYTFLTWGGMSYYSLLVILILGL